ncbi:protein of unknown function DUF668 [Dillenia turbinata]|uniref:DUF668 domain-containing protein n=1 Tax=Dillenia turbinata TaxID=194707 RepID=A0AAN8VSF0_9MAGN
MGAVCSGGTVKRDAKYSGRLKTKKSFNKKDVEEKIYTYSGVDSYEKTPQGYDSGELGLSISRELKPSTPARTQITKAPQVGSFIGRASIVGLERAVEVLDTLGSSVSNLNAGSGFVSGIASRGNSISILAFEVANTIVKGANLLQSLSEENIQFLKKEILTSEGVQLLVSTNMTELLKIAASDKREEFDVFSREVIRFGNLCKDPQWHNLERFFAKLDTDTLTNKQPVEEAELIMQELITLAQHTSELYHELHALDRFEQDYRRKLEEVESLNLPRRGEGLTMLHSELKYQRKLVRSLKKKSLWSKTLEGIMEKLLDVASFLHQEICEAFGYNGVTIVRNESSENPQRLGVAGLALHYANIINQIDSIASRPTAFPPNTRNTLYQGLPTSVKMALRSKLQMLDANEELTIPQIKAEMEKTLQWLVPVATNTTKAHQGFGWVGEWANTGNEFDKNTTTNNNLIRLQTLYHANKQRADVYILELVTWLHRLVAVVRNRDHGLKPLAFRSPTHKGPFVQAEMQQLPSMRCKTPKLKLLLSQEDRNLLEEVCCGKLTPGLSKSQEFAVVKGKGNKVSALSRSTGSSPNREFKRSQDFREPKTNSLDV